ncbi:MAG TPA: DUF58 domain-containing protein [Propionibacteriaceae bacterium]|nr:DUF58 domain-containing protein [Propionibacteriaceae bacterium]HPZ48500.1 DUF58 domain-containing protein [Propionibacteriaceae bacterium]
MRRNPWPLLTFRGKAFVLLGGLTVVLSMIFGQRDVLWFGLFLVMVPLVALLVVARARLRLSCERRVSPPEVVVGDRMVGELVVSKLGTLPTGLLRFEDDVPRGLGRRPRFTVHRFAGEWRREISYPMIGAQRGRFATGPLTVRATDPFSLVKLDRRFTATSDVMVTPLVVPLPGMRNASGAGMSGESTPQKVGVVGTDDVLVREYRAGDDVRRIHWRSTARRDELMVRREEQAWDPAASVLLDSRAVAHAGEGRTSSFEWAVSAATSIALHFLDSGFRVDLFDSDGSMVSQERSVQTSATRQQIIDQMTEVGLTSRTTLARAVEAATMTQRGQLMVAVTGRLSSGDAELLLATQRNRARCFALVIDADSFTARSERSTPEQYDDHQVAMAMLRDHRWRVLEVPKGTDLLEAWSQLDRMGEFV